ncbi:16551_t:CDS:2, partial [Racocetra fulgida]
MGKIQEIIKEVLPGIYTYSIMVGEDESEDKKSSFFGNINEEVNSVCEKLKADINLKYGISDIPGCEGNDGWCKLMRSIASQGAYSGYVRNHIIQAQYFKDPKRLDIYLKKNIFLPDINNELEVKNETYKKNLVTLNKLVLIRFTEDTTLKPGDTAVRNVVPVREQKLYKEDWIGLKTLDEAGRLVFKDCE